MLTRRAGLQLPMRAGDLEPPVRCVISVRGVGLPKIRRAMQTVAQFRSGSRPLFNIIFETDGLDLFIEQLPKKFLNVSLGGQYAFRPILAAFL